MKISFDFDSTLSTKKIRKMLSCFDRSKMEVFIITSRSEDLTHKNSDVWAVVEEFNIPKENVYMTCGMPKGEVCKRLEIEMHFDDMPEEIAYIQATCPKTLGVLVTTNIFGDMAYLNDVYSEPTPSIQQFEDEFE